MEARRVVCTQPGTLRQRRKRRCFPDLRLSTHLAGRLSRAMRRNSAAMMRGASAAVSPHRMMDPITTW